MTGPLLDDHALHASAVVANNAMNRERQLAGANSYAKELGFDPVAWLVGRLDSPETEPSTPTWLDLCCGSGRALIQAAGRLDAAGLGDRVTLVGVDLVDYFVPPTPGGTAPQFVCAPITDWEPSRQFDLITCVHGLHYVGDTLGVLGRVAAWLTGTGLFVGDLDLASIRLADARPAGRRLSIALRQAGFDYDPRRHRIGRTGHGEVSLPYGYLGADDRAGPNYTGQPAVHSVYRELRADE